MPNTRITREKLSTHLHYGKWVYILIAVLAYFAVDLAYTMTEYRPPKERKVEVQIVGSYVNTDGFLAEVAAKMLADGQAQDETLEEVSIFALNYSGDPEQDIYGAQKYMVMLAAQEGDIYMVSRPLLEQLVSQGAALPLDPYLQDGTLRAEGMDLSGVTFAEPAPSEDEAPSGEEHVYALPAAGLNRMLEADISYDNRDQYLVIVSYCANPDTTARAMQTMIDQLTAPPPEPASAEDAPQPTQEAGQQQE